QYPHPVFEAGHVRIRHLAFLAAARTGTAVAQQALRHRLRPGILRSGPALPGDFRYAAARPGAAGRPQRAREASRRRAMFQRPDPTRADRFRASPPDLPHPASFRFPATVAGRILHDQVTIFAQPRSYDRGAGDGSSTGGSA
ncbi:MAG: hypothetical protein ACTHL1_11475, partial [Burkholderiaceae bacterium]